MTGTGDGDELRCGPCPHPGVRVGRVTSLARVGLASLRELDVGFHLVKRRQRGDRVEGVLVRVVFYW